MKANVRKQQDEATTILVRGIKGCPKPLRSPRHCRFTPVLSSGPQAGDISCIAWVLKRSGCTWERSKLAAALCATIAMTLHFASIVGCPPVPWTAAYGRRVRTKLLHCWFTSAQVMNTAFQACSHRSFLGCGTQAQALEKIDAIVALMKDFVSKVPDALAAGRRNSANLRPALKAKGFPRDGYMMSLAMHIWEALSGSKLANAVANVDREDWALLDYGNCLGSGACKGVAALTGDDASDLQRNPPKMSKRVREVSAAIKQFWPECRPNCRWPQGWLTEGAMCAQLCAWASNGFPEEPKDARTITQCLELVPGARTGH